MQYILTCMLCRNCSVRSEAVEQRVVALGVCAPLLAILDTPRWPNCLRDCAGGLLQSLSERWDNVQAMGGLRCCPVHNYSPHCHSFSEQRFRSYHAYHIVCMCSHTGVTFSMAAIRFMKVLPAYGLSKTAQRLAQLQRPCAQHLDVPAISTQVQVSPVQPQHHKR